MTRVRATARHRPPDREAIVVEAGAVLTAGRLDDEWPAFRWCVDERGLGGWIPDRYLSHEAPGRARCLHGYSTRELAVDPGDLLELLETDDESGWHRCRDAAGREGWVPVRSLAAMTVPRLRAAAPGDEPRLREIAEVSKAHWGHDRERVRRWAAELDLSREIWVAERDREIVAWIALLPPDDGACELDDLWVDPHSMGSGIGTALFRHIEARARELGAQALRWEAEPNAVGFYERLGAVTISTATSSWGRTIPVMRVEL